MKFEVEVTRVAYAHRTFVIEAASEEKARCIAEEQAGNYEFSEKDSEYFAGPARKIEEK